ncbi:MAG TPA: WhiB family transcriptional regulator [Actinomycetota bacterium]|nr:WhiB family transcriptional regulator [Actinomycetota bacterium]
MIVESIHDWQTQAACRGMDPAIFFSPDDDAAGVARAVCSICPVKAECLSEAMSRGEVYGVWGGTRERDRRADPPRRARPDRIATTTAAAQA